MVARDGSSSGEAVSPRSLPMVRPALWIPHKLPPIVCLKCFLKLPCVFAGLSAELQTVLQMMLAPEPSERPTVSQLLALPSVRKHRWKRRMYLMAAETVLTLASLCQVIGPVNILNMNLLGLKRVAEHYQQSKASLAITVNY